MQPSRAPLDLVGQEKAWHCFIIKRRIPSSDDRFRRLIRWLTERISNASTFRFLSLRNLPCRSLDGKSFFETNSLVNPFRLFWTSTALNR
jgi:hypothetical protein